MCGIAGFIEFTPKYGEEVISAMTTALLHRGPDASGINIWNNQFAKIAFGHSRLAIIDLSKGGAQPKTKNNWHITFNGEIYNYQEIKSDLISLGHSFSSNSDTEVILSSLEQWGIECIEKFIGMFAFGAYNSETNMFYLVRDRAGIKPLYYHFNESFIVFGSELKALCQYPDLETTLSTHAIADYFTLGYIPAPKTIYNSCNKLEAGHYIKINLKTKQKNKTKYWSPYSYLKEKPLKISEAEYLNETETLLKSAFNYRMVADVPIGVFLSGGYDSTLVTALLQSGSTNSSLKTFTIGFKDKNYDESIHAEKIATHLNTDHTTIICDINETKDIIPLLPNIYDEPFGDPSAIPTYLVSKFASTKVKVALSADGGDEQFIGYNRYPNAIKIAQRSNQIPEMLKELVASCFKQNSYLNSKQRIRQKIYEIIKSRDISQIPNIQNKSLFESELKSLIINYKPLEVNSDFINNRNINLLFASEYCGYMQDDILTKVDRASMAVGLETRDPLIDHRIAEWTLKTQIDLKYKNKILKYPLKKIVHKYVPKHLVDRKKQGFSIPVISWLKSDLSYLVFDLINKKNIVTQGIFNWPFIEKKLNRFNEGCDDSDNNKFIWHMFVFQLWYRRWVTNNN